MSYLAYYGYWNADYPVDWDSKVLAEGWTHGQFEADQFAFHYFADEPDFASWAKKSFLTAEEGIALSWGKSPNDVSWQTIVDGGLESADRNSDFLASRHPDGDLCLRVVHHPVRTVGLS